MPGMPAGFASGPPPGGSISPSQLASQAAYTVLGNPTAAPASPIATTDPVVSGSSTAARFLASANNTAAAPTLLLEPSGNSGWRWDGTLGDVASVDAIDRLMLRVGGTAEFSSGAGGGTPVLRLTSTAGDVNAFVLVGSPEGVISDGPGSLSIDPTNGRLYLKRSGVGNTGWVQIDRCESGTYTATCTAITNLDAVSATGTLRHMRVGDTVFVGGTINIDPTASGSVTFDLSLPIASAFTTAYQLSGQVNTQQLSGSIFGEATNDVARCVLASNTSTGAYDVRVSFSYVVL